MVQRAGEYPCVRLVGHIFGEVRADFGDDGFGDWFGAFASGGLRRPGDDAGAGESGAADVDETVVEVDVAALEGADLADAQASAGDGEGDGEPEFAWHGVVDPPELLWCGGGCLLPGRGLAHRHDEW